MKLRCREPRLIRLCSGPLSPKMFTPSPTLPPNRSQYFHTAVDTVLKCLWKSFYCHGWRRHKITISVTNELVRERRQLDLCQRSWGTANVLNALYDCVPPRPVSVCHWQAVNVREKFIPTQQKHFFVFYQFLKLQNVSACMISPSRWPNVDFVFV